MDEKAPNALANITKYRVMDNIVQMSLLYTKWLKMYTRDTPFLKGNVKNVMQFEKVGAGIILNLRRSSKRVGFISNKIRDIFSTTV